MKKIIVVAALVLGLLTFGCDPTEYCYDTYYVTEYNWTTGQTERTQVTVEYECFEEREPNITNQ